MPKADAAAADDITDATDESADQATTDAAKTPGDHPDARAQGDADKATTSADDSVADSDPLLLAQQEVPREAKDQPAAAKPAATPAPKPDQRADDQARPAPATKPATETPKPAEGEADEDAKLAIQDIPPDDWSRMSHKAKSQFLAQRRVIKTSDDARKQVKELTRYRTDYETVQKFVRDQGLEDQEYINGVAIAGAAKRNDARVLPMLEETMARIRQANGLPDRAAAPPAPATPAVDADELVKLIDDAENSLDFANLRARVAKLKAPATTPAAPAQPAAQASAPAARQPAAAPASAQVPSAELAENLAILDALQGLGIEQGRVVDYAKGLIGEIAGRGQIPAVGSRLRAVLEAHKAKESVPAAPPPRAPSTPLSGRRGPVVRTGRQDPNTPVDPLQHAMRG